MNKNEDDIKVISKFAEKLISSQKDIEPEIQEVINEHFNEMLFEID